MKKYIGIICAILLAFTLSSCGVKEELTELELEGRKISASSAADMMEDWEKYNEDLLKEEEIFDNWISVNLNKISKSSNEDGNSETYMSLSGKIYESYYAFDTKMSLTLKIQGTSYDKDSSAETEYHGTIDVIYIDGRAYYDVSLTSKTYGEYETTTVKYNELILGDIDDLQSVIGFYYQPGVSFESMAVSSFIGSLSAIVAEDEDSKAYQDDEVYGFEREVEEENEYNDSYTKSVSQMSMKMKEEYEVKNFETYSSRIYRQDEISTETITTASYKTSLGALIIKPLNHKKYTDQSLSEIINSIIGGNK